MLADTVPEVCGIKLEEEPTADKMAKCGRCSASASPKLYASTDACRPKYAR